MKSSSNAKQKDRVASYARQGLDGLNNKSTNQKSSYRARGCRGGTSRKPSTNRKKSSSDDGDVHNEENDPSRLNSGQRCQFTNDSSELTYKKHSELVDTSSKSSSKAKTASKPRKRRSRRCSTKSNEDESKPDGNRKGLSLAILPNNGAGLTDGVDGVEVELSNPAPPILPATNATHAAAERESKTTQRPAGSPRKFSSIIGRPSSPISRTTNSGGFTFFSISPRSFLGGKRRGVSSPKKR